MAPVALIPIGIFGAIVSVGLWLYELRQIDLCKHLENHATWLESELGIKAGQFGGRRDRLGLRDVYSPTAHKKRNDELTEAEKRGQHR